MQTQIYIKDGHNIYVDSTVNISDIINVSISKTKLVP
jgi:hypothetical protein